MAQELKAHDLVDIQDYRGEVYLKSEVDAVLSEKDAAIAELKNEINRKECVEQRWFERCMEARTENVSLKRALWLGDG